MAASTCASRPVHVPANAGWTTRTVEALPRQHEDRDGMWHSQHGQDRIVSTLLSSKRGGFFLDLAASTPLLHSNTRTLERDFGWSGVCIEANPRFWGPLVSWRCGCTIVGAAVAEQRSEAGFHFYGPFAGMGGLTLNGTDNAGRPETIRVQVVTIAEIFQQFAVPLTIDYMSLDVREQGDLTCAPLIPTEPGSVTDGSSVRLSMGYWILVLAGGRRRDARHVQLSICDA